MILFSKFLTLVAWLLIVFNWISPIEAWHANLHWAGVGLAIAHSVEVIVFLPLAKKAGGNVALHALQLWVFGYAHKMQLDESLAKAQLRP